MNRSQLVRRRSLRGAGLKHELMELDSRRASAGRLLGAAEICLLARDPHLAARALWLLLKDQEPVHHKCAQRAR